MKRLIHFLITLLLFVTPASAHDAKLHKGPMIHGKVISLNGDKAELKTETGNVVVNLSSETVYELGTAATPGNKTDLKVGASVMVQGHKLETGEFGAKEIMIHTEEEAAASEHHGQTDTH